MDLKSAERGLGKIYKAREGLMPLQREIVLRCSKAIRKVHAGKPEEARSDAAEISKMLKKLEREVGSRAQLQRLLSVPQQEYAELEILLSVIETGRLPKVGVPEAAYLLGAQDAIGELKRVCMELLAQGKTKEALFLFKKMEGMYHSMEGYAFPNSLVPGFKHKQDAMKGVLERLHHTLSEARMRG